METQKYEKLRILLDEFQQDYIKAVERGNKSAAIRVRKGMQDLKRLAQDVRIEVSEKTKS